MGCQQQAVIIMHYLIPIGNFTPPTPQFGPSDQTGRGGALVALLEDTSERRCVYLLFIVSVDESVASSTSSSTSPSSLTAFSCVGVFASRE